MTDELIYKEAIERLVDHTCFDCDFCSETLFDCEEKQCDLKDAVKVAIEALEKHTPKKPNWQGDEKCMDAYCPYCGSYLDDYENPCENCTQFIDWSE